MRKTQSEWVSVSLLLIGCQLLKNLHFHPKLGIVTRTIAGAASDLSFFMALLIAICFIFAVLGVMTFGDYSKDFSDPFTAVDTCLKLLVGLYDPTDVLRDAPEPIYASIFFWSFMVS